MMISVIPGSRPSSSSVSATRSPRERPEGRLVEHHQPRVGGARHRYLQLALLPVRERADGHADARAEPDSRLRALVPVAAARGRGCPAEPGESARRACPARRGRGCPRRSVRGTNETFGRSAPFRASRAPEAASVLTSSPRKSIVPELGLTSPEMTLNNVVLPAPFGPRIARLSPCATSRSTSRTAWRPPKRRPIPRKRRIGSAFSGRCYVGHALRQPVTGG